MDEKDFHPTGWDGDPVMWLIGCKLLDIHDPVQIERRGLTLYYRCSRCGRKMPRETPRGYR